MTRHAPYHARSRRLPLSIREDPELSPPEMPSIEGNRIPVSDLVSHEGGPTRPFADLATSPPRSGSRRFFARCLPLLPQLRHLARPLFTTLRADTAERRFLEPERRASTSATFLDARARCMSGLSSPASEAMRPPRRCAISFGCPKARDEPHGSKWGVSRRRQSTPSLELPTSTLRWRDPCGPRDPSEGLRLAASYPPQANPSSVRVTVAV